MPPPLKITISSGGGGGGKKAKQTPQQRAQNAAALSAAEQTIHVYDPWVVPIYKDGIVTSFKYVAGVSAPKGVLTYGGEPLTKLALSTMWSDYKNAFEQFTGKVARPNDIVGILKRGLTPMGMQAMLAKEPGFTKSPIYLSSAGDVNAAAKAILGTAAPKEIVQAALAQNWDSATLQEHLRKQPGYTKGPEFQTNYAQMKGVYQKIYGQPDAGADQSIKETAANGWSPDQFANYLRTQPQYKTSLEYESNATSFLDAMGLLIGARSTLTPTQTLPTGGTAVPNSPLVKGAPKPLTPNLPFQPGLAGAEGLAK